MKRDLFDSIGTALRRRLAARRQSAPMVVPVAAALFAVGASLCVLAPISACAAVA